MMQMLLDQQARVYSKESEMLRKEMDQLKVSIEKIIIFSIIKPNVITIVSNMSLYGVDRI